MRVSDEELDKRQKDTIQMWVGPVIDDLRDLRKLARGLINKLEEIERSPEYRHVWENNLIHGDRQYQGPVCKEEMKTLKAHLEAKP